MARGFHYCTKERDFHVRGGSPLPALSWGSSWLSVPLCFWAALENGFKLEATQRTAGSGGFAAGLFLGVLFLNRGSAEEDLFAAEG